MPLEYVYKLIEKERNVQTQNTFYPIAYMCGWVGACVSKAGSSFDSRFVDFCGHTNNH